MALEMHSEHYDSILNIPTVFQTAFERYTQNVQKPFDAGSQRILSIRTAFIKNSGWLYFIPFKCDGAFTPNP